MSDSLTGYLDDFDAFLEETRAEISGSPYDTESVQTDAPLLGRKARREAAEKAMAMQRHSHAVKEPVSKPSRSHASLLHSSSGRSKANTHIAKRMEEDDDFAPLPKRVRREPDDDIPIIHDSSTPEMDTAPAVPRKQPSISAWDDDDLDLDLDDLDMDLDSPSVTTPKRHLAATPPVYTPPKPRTPKRAHREVVEKPKKPSRFVSHKTVVVKQAKQKPVKKPRQKKGNKLSGKGGLIFLYIVMAICLIGLIIVVPKIVTTINEYQEAKAEYAAVSQSAIFVREQPQRDSVRDIILSEPDSSALEEPEIEEAIDNYMASWVPIEVDWDSLLATNDDVIGWIYCDEIGINYPVTQTDNNYYYLSRTVSGKYNSSGTIFANYQSVLDNRLSNFILYGHHMKNDTMFGMLDHYKDSNYFFAHPTMYFLTPEQTYKILLISGHIVESSSRNFPLLFASDEEYQNYLNSIVSSCPWGQADLATTQYQLITLVTCDYSYGYADPRYIVQGMMQPLGVSHTEEN